MKFKKIILYIGGIIVFLLGMIVFGLLSDLRKPKLEELLKAKNITKIVNPIIVINKIDYKLHLYSDTILIKSYDVIFGKNPKYKKRSKDDRFTPSGEYYICVKRDNDYYEKFMLLSFPNVQDAKDGLASNFITKKEFNKIYDSIINMKIPPMNTGMGGNIGIHGNGKYDIILRNLPFIFNWTNGSIAMDNTDIKELYEVCKTGTKVSVY